jgi:hypothetical protein
VCLIVCDLKTSKTRRLRANFGCNATENKEKPYQLIQYKVTQLTLRLCKQKSSTHDVKRTGLNRLTYGTVELDIHLVSGFVGIHLYSLF